MTFNEIPNMLNMDDGASERQNNRCGGKDATGDVERRGSLVKNEPIVRNGSCCTCATNGFNKCSPANERFLVRSTDEASQKKQSQRKVDSRGDSDLNMKDQDLVHVFVTRPEIAGKPRDNIVFEGDMDLKTTFETSYENLAKLRLNHWKQHQQTGRSEQDLNHNHHHHDYQQQQQQQGVSVEELIERDLSSTINDESSDSEANIHFTANKVESLNGTVQANSSHPKQVLDGANEETGKLFNPTHQPFIDPDLSSIFVYNENMNRLDKVGVRKRSKYRPSTSLRTGARGLFGDQSEEGVELQATKNFALDECSLSDSKGEWINPLS